MDDRPICYDLYAGLGGFSEGFLVEGYKCVGFDIEAHDYGTGGYPGEFHLRDVRSIHGSELQDAAVIVASPPCQAYSYRAMPWKRAKALPPPDNTLFNECFRIQREAIAAAGHHIPLIVENVRGAQKWVGRARWNYGSFYLWGDVPALMPHTFKGTKLPAGNCAPILWKDRDIARMSHAGELDCEKIAHHIDGRKVGMNFHEHEKTGKPGRDWFGKDCESSMSRLYGSKSPKRKMASAMIAKIPLPLSLHLARVFKPERLTEPSRAGRENS